MDELEIRKFFEIIKDNENLTEIRIIESKTKNYSGYFTNVDDLLGEVKKYNKGNIYFTLNSINEACASRTQANRIIQNPKTTTSDNDIVARDWILIDIDPKRPADTNSSDDEKKKAQSVVNSIYNYLRNVGFASPVISDSGNGYHLLYKVSMSNSPENTILIKNFLEALALTFFTDNVDVDTSVFNASRICKLYGTYSRKGSNTEDRPQRQSKILKVPNEIKKTSIHLIQKVVNDLLPKREEPTFKNNYSTSFDIDSFLKRNNIQVDKEYHSNGMRKILLRECPFDSNHKSPDSAIFVMSNGAIGFKCFHNSCQSNNWSELRAKYEPKKDYRQYNIERPKPNNSKSSLLFETDNTNNSNNDNADINTGSNQQDRKDAFINLKDIENEDRSKITTIKTMINGLDDSIKGFNLQEISMWSGNNSSGKSTLLGQLALNAVQQGYPVALFSGELTTTRIKKWLTLQAAGRQYLDRSSYGDYYYVPKQNIAFIDDWAYNKLYVYDNKYGNKFKQLMSDVEKIVDKGVKMVILDNLMALDILQYDGDRNSKQSQFILDLTNFAKKKNIHIHIVAHPRKATGFLRKNDIAGSGDLSNAVDNVFIVHRVNNDFIRHAGEFFGVSTANSYLKYSNVIEVCKNRDLGIIDHLVGTYFEVESKRFLNDPYENITYGWVPKQGSFSDMPIGDDFDLPE